MSDLEILSITGTVGKAPEKTKNGGYVVRVATHVYNSKEKKEEANWYSVFLSEAQAGLVPYLTPGSKVAVSGRLILDVYEGKVQRTIFPSQFSLIHSTAEKGKKTGDDMDPDADGIPF